MTSPTPATSRSRRPKRWAVVGAVVVALVGGAWLLSSDPPEVEEARGVKIGMTKAEVAEVFPITQPVIAYLNANHSGYAVGATRSRLHGYVMTFKSLTGWNFDESPDSWPVHIRFDSSGRVDRIKRGNEIVEKP